MQNSALPPPLATSTPKDCSEEHPAEAVSHSYIKALALHDLVMPTETNRSDFATELAEDDGMNDLRGKIHEINSRYITHELRAAALRVLMTTKPNSGLISNLSSTSSTKLRDKLPEVAVAAPRLEALPVELVENIARGLTVQDFAAFRLSTRTLHDKTNYAFTKQFFEKRVIDLEWQSLRRLAIILNHATLGRAIKHLVVMVEEEGRFLRDAKPRNRYGHFGEDYRNRGGNDSAQARSLQTILDRTLSRIPVLMSLEFRATTAYSMSSQAIAIAFAAIALSGTKIRSLRIGGQHDAERGIFFDHGGRLRTILTQENKSLRRSLESLTWLELSWTQETREPECECTNSLLMLSPTVEVLVLWENKLETEMNSVDYLNSFRTPLPKLRVVKLCDPNLDATGRYWRSVVAFLQRCGGSVEELHICRTQRPPSKFDIMLAERVGKELHIAKVEIHGMAR